MPVAAEETEHLAARGVPVIDGEVVAVETVDDRLAGGTAAWEPGRCPGGTGGGAADGGARRLPRATRDAAGGASGRGGRAHSGGRTDVPGVWVAGNVTDPAAAAGAAVVVRISADLVAEETRQAVDARRARVPGPSHTPVR
ncbi:hypothetical protein [Rhodococcus indonesiensis]